MNTLPAPPELSAETSTPTAQPPTTQRVLRRRRSPWRRWPRALGILDRYVLRCLATSSWRGLLWFGGLLVTVAIITAARQISDKSLPLSSMMMLVWLQLPRVFLFALPMAVLFGATEAFSELSSSGEMTAIFAAGNSLRRLMRMPILWGIALTVLSFVVQNVLVPRAEVAKNKVVAEAAVAAFGDGPITFQDPPEGQGALQRMVRAQRFDARTNTLIRPVVQVFDATQHLSLQISAESGVWDRETNLWHFKKGQLTAFPPSSTRSDNATKKTSNASYSLEFDELKRDDAPSPGVLAGERTLRQHMLHGDFEVTTFAQLQSFRAQIQAENATDALTSAQNQTLIQGLTYGLHDKIATPLVCIALILVGVPLGLRPPRSGSGFAVGSSLMVLLFYYLLWSWAHESGFRGQGNSLLLAYIGPLAVAIAGMFLLWRKRL